MYRPRLIRSKDILDPFVYTASHAGKGVRARLFGAFNVWMNVPHAEMEIFEKVVGMLHDTSLISDVVDRVLDDWRSTPITNFSVIAAHTVYGIPRTINAATYPPLGIFRPGDDFDWMENNCTVAELDCLHHGQGLDILWRDSFLYAYGQKQDRRPFEDGVRLMMACSTTNRDMDYVALVDLIGAHYQIRDDYMNLRSPDYSANKGYAEDIEEGKFSFPIIHGVHCINTSNQLILDVLKTRPATLTLKTQVIGYLEHETKSFDYTVAVLDALEVEINKEILNFEGNAELSEIVKGLHVDGTIFN
ncbi:farnesyltranstransferase [Mycena albidolilacea]|uniref:(2E,6E)-farnesyl diphosphate synthase n=1 Tax=Mycena albidolilacea TaxID=1033008 RepID=A0AAD7A2E2_9AGAR|nr:farnesyltranstransferase [Mycena albidolilacea]